MFHDRISMFVFFPSLLPFHTPQTPGMNTGTFEFLVKKKQNFQRERKFDTGVLKVSVLEKKEIKVNH